MSRLARAAITASLLFPLRRCAQCVEFLTATSTAFHRRFLSHCFSTSARYANAKRRRPPEPFRPKPSTTTTSSPPPSQHDRQRHKHIIPSSASVDILELLRPLREDQPQSAASDPPMSSSLSPSSSSDTSASLPPLSPPSGAETTVSILELLRPEPVEDASVITAVQWHTSPATTQAATSSSTVTSFIPPSPPTPFSTSSSVTPITNSASELDSLVDPSSEEGDEEFQRYMTEPLSSPPTFDVVSQQIDALLDLDLRGHKMFPLYMRDRLKLLSLSHMHRVITEMVASSLPYTEHDLHTRLFSHLVKHAAKLAHTDDERITILCPDAPMVGSKVPHPQWPELTTVVRRYFTSSRGELQMDVDQDEVMKSGKVTLRQLFSGLDGGPEVEVSEGELIVDLDTIDEDTLRFEMEGEEGGAAAGGDRGATRLESMSASQRQIWDLQQQAREQARDVMRRRIKSLKRKRQQYQKTQAEAAAASGRQPDAVRKVMDAKVDDDAEDVAMSASGGVRQLAVVYRFDSGDEFEMRYPLSRKDVKRLELFEEDADKNDTVIR